MDLKFKVLGDLSSLQKDLNDLFKKKYKVAVGGAGGASGGEAPKETKKQTEKKRARAPEVLLVAQAAHVDGQRRGRVLVAPGQPRAHGRVAEARVERVAVDAGAPDLRRGRGKRRRVVEDDRCRRRRRRRRCS